VRRRRLFPKSFKQTLRDNVAAMSALAMSMDKDDPRYEREQERLRKMKEDLPPIRTRNKNPDFKTEHQEQVEVIWWWRKNHEKYGFPEFTLFAIPNGGIRDPITASRLKSEGVRRGVLDLMLVVPSNGYHGLFIEMKAGYNKPTPEQTAFMEHLKGQGYHCAVHWNSASAVKEIEEYLCQSRSE
jgi:hypothetical protein